MPHTCAMTTGANTNIVISVGTSCCLTTLTPASKAISPEAIGVMVISNAVRSPNAALKSPPLEMKMRRPLGQIVFYCNWDNHDASENMTFRHLTQIPREIQAAILHRYLSLA